LRSTSQVAFTRVLYLDHADRSHRPAITKLLIIAFAVLILTPPAGANVLAESDAERFFSLSRNSK
jgi:hypothetical protein